MCGLAGLYAPQHAAGPVALEQLVEGMADALRHRGPDSGGTWTDAEAGIALGHRRLAIVDLSPEGHQPMVSACGRYMFVFNGEIYNFRKLRADPSLSGQVFRGRSDTEVLLALIVARGLESALSLAAGMFALVLWDRRDRVLHLARDRLGKKPLYIGRIGDAVAFASELKALTQLPGFQAEIDRNALATYFRRQFVPAPRTIWRSVRKLPAGTVLTLRCDGDAPGLSDIDAGIRPYWSAEGVAERGQAEVQASSDRAYLDTLASTLSLAVAERMITDVPLGAFLSGGVDSSLVVAMMQNTSTTPIKTFTIGFDEAAFDETAKARGVARHLGTEHVEVHISAKQARDIIPALPDIYDEPFADVSQIPSCHIARVAREAVTVCLSGDGGDESFGGYGRYRLASNLEHRLSYAPAPLRRVASSLMRNIPVGGWDRMLRFVDFGVPEGYRGALTGDRMHKFAGLVGAADGGERYERLLDLGAARVFAPDTVADQGSGAPASLDYTHRMMLADTITYLPEDVLVKVDRSSMKYSLEVRAPLLDHRVVEFAWSMPARMKLRDGQSKWALRQLLERYLPADLVDQGKAGFGVPIGEWLRGPLREWAETLLSECKLRSENLLDVSAVRQLWSQHLSGRYNHAAPLWSILMFEAWHGRWMQPERLDHSVPARSAPTREAVSQ